VTVPACLSCNQGASRDDEYFRASLVFEGAEAGNSDAMGVLPAVHRSLRRPSAAGFRQAFLSGIRPVERISPAGLHLGTTWERPVDRRRLNNVVARITRGLFRHHSGRRLPIECEVDAFTSRALSQGGAATVLELIGDLRSPVHSIGNGAFSYRCSVAHDQENSSFWMFVVYGAFSFASLTLDRG
jgi:hypothetical protein